MLVCRNVIPVAAMCLFVCVCCCSCLNEDEEVLTREGTVQRVEVAGNCWRIVSHDGVGYEPTNLPDEFKKDGLEVRFSAKLRDDLVTTCMVGQVVELLGIRKAS